MLYVPENCQGSISNPIADKWYNVQGFLGSKVANCTYVDMAVKIVDAEGCWKNYNAAMYLGSDCRTNFDVVRNVSTAITVKIPYVPPIIEGQDYFYFENHNLVTVNGGEITAGHYESEYYTYTDGYIYKDSSPTPGFVNSVTPGNAVLVRRNGSFTSNGGEYYGRGFIMDDDGGKEGACAALSLFNDTEATINAGSFYGKSNADVFSIDPTASVKVYSGNFYARYDSRITVDKMNGIAYYVNTDCGRIGLPLKAFRIEMESFTHMYVNGTEFNYSSDYTQSDNEWFIDLGSDGTGADVAVETMSGNGTKNEPFQLKNSSDIENLFHLRRDVGFLKK